MKTLQQQRICIAAAFAVQGLLFITLTTHLPAIKEKFSLGDATLSLILLGVVLLAGAGSVAAEAVATKTDSATALRVGLAMLAVGYGGFALAPGLSAALSIGAIAALGIGVVDATTNMQAVAVEHAYGRPILPSFHGAWTAGGIVATLAALATGHLSLTWAVAPVALLPLLILPAPYARRTTLPAAADSPSDLTVPWRRVVLIGIVLVLFYMVDTASTTWGPVYLHGEFGTGLDNVAVATLPYLLATLAARLVGDRLLARFGGPWTLQACAVVAMAALALIVFAPSTPVAVAGFAVLGLGAGVIAPLSFSAAGAIAGSNRARVDAVIARFNQFNYLGGLLGAVLTGLVGADSLRWGFALPMVLVLAIIPLARHVHTVSDQATPARPQKSAGPHPTN